jgi:hypothetical protein
MKTPKIKSEEEMREEFIKTYQVKYEIHPSDLYVIANHWLSIIKEREGGNLSRILKKMDEYEYHKDQVHCTCLGALREYLINGEEA